MRFHYDYGGSPEWNKFENERVAREIAKLKTPCDYIKWAVLDAWTIKQATCIINGLDPDAVLVKIGIYWFKKEHQGLFEGDWHIFEQCLIISDYLDRIFLNLRGSYLAGNLQIIGQWIGSDTLISPPIVASWALSKGYAIHEGLALLETPPLMAGRLNQADRHPWEIICEIESRWPKLPKYKVAAVVKGLDPDDEDTRKQAENFYQKSKKEYLGT